MDRFTRSITAFNLLDQRVSIDSLCEWLCILTACIRRDTLRISSKTTSSAWLKAASRRRLNVPRPSPCIGLPDLRTIVEAVRSTTALNASTSSRFLEPPNDTPCRTLPDCSLAAGSRRMSRGARSKRKGQPMVYFGIEEIESGTLHGTRYHWL